MDKNVFEMTEKNSVMSARNVSAKNDWNVSAKKTDFQAFLTFCNVSYTYKITFAWQMVE